MFSKAVAGFLVTAILGAGAAVLLFRPGPGSGDNEGALPSANATNDPGKSGLPEPVPEIGVAMAAPAIPESGTHYQQARAQADVLDKRQVPAATDQNADVEDVPERVLALQRMSQGAAPASLEEFEQALQPQNDYALGAQAVDSLRLLAATRAEMQGEVRHLLEVATANADPRIAERARAAVLEIDQGP